MDDSDLNSVRPNNTSNSQYQNNNSSSAKNSTSIDSDFVSSDFQKNQSDDEEQKNNIKIPTLNFSLSKNENKNVSFTSSLQKNDDKQESVPIINFSFLKQVENEESKNNVNVPLLNCAASNEKNISTNDVPSLNFAGTSSIPSIGIPPINNINNFPEKYFDEEDEEEEFKEKQNLDEPNDVTVPNIIVRRSNDLDFDSLNKSIQSQKNDVIICFPYQKFDDNEFVENFGETPSITQLGNSVILECDRNHDSSIPSLNVIDESYQNIEILPNMINKVNQESANVLSMIEELMIEIEELKLIKEKSEIESAVLKEKIRKTKEDRNKFNEAASRLKRDFDNFLEKFQSKQ